MTYVPKRTSTSRALIPQPALDELERVLAASVEPDRVEEAAFRIYESIRTEQSRVSGLEEARKELSAYQAMLRVLQSFAGSRRDDTAKRVYATISRFNLGEMFRPGGGADRYLIPVELTNQEPESDDVSAGA